MKTVEERFWSKVDKSAGPDACWLWTARRNARGYGSFSIGPRMLLAHRVSWELAGGEIPVPSTQRALGSCVCHKCDNPPCVNPAHLFLGTHADNMQDRDKKNRGATFPGLLHGRAKVSEQDVREIRRLYKEGVVQTQLTRLFPLSQTQISRIVRGELWSHI